MSTVLIVGGDSSIGTLLTEFCKNKGHKTFCTTRRKETVNNQRLFLDLSEPELDTMKFPDVEILIIVAAMSKFIDNRTNPELARLINVTNPIALANKYYQKKSQVVILSTAAVLDGKNAQMLPDRPYAPTSIYGLLKSEVEQEILRLGNSASVIRLSKVLSRQTQLICDWIDELKRGQAITAFQDMSLSPITLHQAVNAIADVMDLNAGGIFQASARKDITYFDLAKHIARKLKVSPKIVIPKNISEASIPRDEALIFTSLNTSRLETLSHWRSPTPEQVVNELYFN